jgi:hypothetical protein
MCGKDSSNDVTEGYVLASRRIDEWFEYPDEKILRFVSLD